MVIPTLKNILLNITFSTMNNAVIDLFPLIAESRKRQCADLVTCPVCHVRVPQDKAQAHLENETVRLEKWMRTYVKRSV